MPRVEDKDQPEVNFSRKTVIQMGQILEALAHEDALALFMYARKGISNSTEAIKKLRRGFEKAGCEFTLHSYPGTSHWFFEEDQSNVFHHKASELAWERTIDFTNKALKLAKRSTGQRKMFCP